MDFSITKILSVITFLAALLLMGLYIFVMHRNKNSKINFSFSMVCLSGALWLFAYSQAYRSSDPAVILLWFKLGYCGVFFISVTYFHFANVFLNIQRTKWIVVFNYFVGIVCAILIGFSGFLINGLNNYDWGFYPKAGKFHPYLLIIHQALLLQQHLSS